MYSILATTARSGSELDTTATKGATRGMPSVGILKRPVTFGRLISAWKIQTVTGRLTVKSWETPCVSGSVEILLHRAATSHIQASRHPLKTTHTIKQTEIRWTVPFSSSAVKPSTIPMSSLSTYASLPVRTRVASQQRRRRTLIGTSNYPAIASITSSASTQSWTTSTSFTTSSSLAARRRSPQDLATRVSTCTQAVRPRCTSGPLACARSAYQSRLEWRSAVVSQATCSCSFIGPMSASGKTTSTHPASVSTTLRSYGRTAWEPSGSDSRTWRYRRSAHRRSALPPVVPTAQELY